MFLVWGIHDIRFNHEHSVSLEPLNDPLSTQNSLYKLFFGCAFIYAFVLLAALQLLISSLGYVMMIYIKLNIPAPPYDHC